MILKIPNEPTEIKDWMQSLKKSQFNDPTVNWDAYVVWAGNKLPKYLWECWKDDLKPLGITWQKFMRILRHRTDVGVMWYQGALPWPDFVLKVCELIRGPIGQEAQTDSLKKVSPSLPMQDLGAFQLPPISDWQKFERLTRDLWSRLWNNPELQLNGRNGQSQGGVDVFGDIDRQAGNIGGVQCKRKNNSVDNSLTVQEIKKNVSDAKKFQPSLNRLVIAYTGQRDEKLQTEARLISEEHRKTGLFSVAIFSWDDIIEVLGKYPELIGAHFPFTVGVNTKKIEEVQDTVDTILENQTEQNQNLVGLVQQTADTIHGQIGSVTELIKSSTDAMVMAKEFNAELDEIRDMINSKRPKEALDRILTLEKRITSGIDASVRFRIITNKAAALAAVGQEKEAGLLFIEAWQYNPTEEKALCNRALGHLLIGQKQEAEKFAQEIIEKNPLSIRAYEIIIYCDSTKLSIDEIVTKIPEAIRETEGVAYALAQAAKEKNNFPAAIKWLEIATKNSSNGDLLANLAATLLQQATSSFDVLSGMQITPADKATIQRVVKLLSDAISPLENSESLKFRVSWLLNRSTAYKILGDLEKAMVDIETAAKLQPDDVVITKQKAFILHEKNNTADAIVLLKQINGKKEVPEVPLLLGGILFETQDLDGAIEVLTKSLKNPSGSIELQEEQKRLLIQIHLKKQDYESARMLSKELRAVDPTNILNLVEAAKIEKIAGQQNAHSSLLDEARSYVTDSTPRRNLFTLADELYSSKRYADAWPLYERLVDITSGTAFTNKLIFSYYKAEQYEKALETSRAVPNQLKDRFTFEIEVSILDSMGDLDGAIEASEKYLADNPQDLAFKIKLAAGLFRKGDMVKLDKFLNEDIDISTLTPDVALDAGRQLAGLYSERGMSERALDTAYWLRKHFSKEADAHLAYFAIFFDREKDLDSKLEASVVGINTAVRVQEKSGVPRWYVIEDKPNTQQNFSELNSTDPIAQKLMGKKVGDEIISDKGRPSESKLIILEIKSKYVHALHETMEIFPQIFADNPDLKSVSMTAAGTGEEPKKEIQPMLDMISSQDDGILQVQKMYEEGKITIGTFANLIGKSPIVIWGGLVSNSRVGIHCCLGTVEERQQAFETLRKNTSIAIDITALLTCGSMERLDLLKESFAQIFITQSTIDLLTVEISHRSGGMGSKGFMTVWKENGQFYRKEVTEEEIKNQIKFLTTVKDWAVKHCKTLPVKEALKLPLERRKQFEQSMGKSFIETILLAKEQGCPIYSDDTGTRAIAKNEFEVSGIWTQAMAIIAQDKGLIDSEELEKINIGLVVRNFRHTTVSATTLKQAAKEAGWANIEPLTSVLNTLGRSNIELKSVVIVAIDFFYLLWKEPLIDFQREALVFAILDTISRKGNRIEILKLLAALIPIRFRLIPLAGQHLIKLVSAWRSLRT